MSVSASKDSSVYTVSVNGTLSYTSIDDIFEGTDILNNPRWIELKEEFIRINPYSYALDAYNIFRGGVPVFEDGSYLNQTPKTENILKSPYTPSISYDYSYTNERDLSPTLKNLNISCSDTRPIIQDGVMESLHGFSVIEDVVNKLGVLSVNSSCDENGQRLSEMMDFVDRQFDSKDKICQFTDRNASTGGSNISYSFNSIYYE